MKYAELAQKDGMTFALGLGGSTNTDAIDTHGALFRAFGAVLIDEKGNMQLDTPRDDAVPGVRQKLVKFYPDDAVSYDDASNNRALISGKTALIFNPPRPMRSPSATRRRCSRYLDVLGSGGPQGPLRADRDLLLGHLAVQQEPVSGEGHAGFLMDRKQVEARDNGVEGYDLPPYAGMLDFPIWEKVEPPPGTVYNYPIRPWHNAQPSLTASEATPDIAVQVYNRACTTR